MKDGQEKRPKEAESADQTALDFLKLWEDTFNRLAQGLCPKHARND